MHQPARGSFLTISELFPLHTILDCVLEVAEGSSPLANTDLHECQPADHMVQKCLGCDLVGENLAFSFPACFLDYPVSAASRMER